jgi:hypothetical protein
MSSVHRLTALALLGLGCVAASATVAAQTYYRCPDGYTFSVNPTNGPTAARCVKPDSWEYKNLVPSQHCAPTLVIAQDRLTNPAGKDQCINGSGSVQVDPNCGGGGWEQDVRPGPDRCKKRVPGGTTFPNVPVQR